MRKRTFSLYLIISFLSFCLGISLISYFGFKIWLLFIYLSLGIVFIAAFPKFLKSGALGIICFLIGSFYVQLFSPPPLLKGEGEMFSSRGVVDGYPQRSRFGILCPVATKEGRVLLAISFYQKGDFLCVPKDTFYFEGKKSLKLTPKERFVERYIAKVNVLKIKKEPFLVGGTLSKKLLLLRFLFLIREKATSSIKELMREKEASFANGLIFGQKTDLPFEFKEKLSKTGTTHLVALSGFNISIFIFAFFDTLKYICLALSFFVTSFFIIAFVLMTGASASVVRAAIMGIMLIAGRVLGRQTDNLLILSFSLFLMALFSPYSLIYDLSLQFSFLSFCGLVYLSPLIKEKLIFLGFLKESLADTLGAIIFVLPLNVYYFGNISLISPLANILVLAVVPLISYLIILQVLFSFLSHFFAQVLSYISQVFLQYCLWVIEFLGSFRGAAIKISHMNLFLVFVYYGFLFLILKYLWELKIECEKRI